MSKIKLTNPKGETKIFDDSIEYLNFKKQILNSQTFISWASLNTLSGTFPHDGTQMLNHLVIEKFVEVKGYKIEKLTGN